MTSFYLDDIICLLLFKGVVFIKNILNKINNHEYLNNNDITRFIRIYSDGKTKVYFLDNIYDKLGIAGLGYIPQFSSIIIDKKLNKYHLELLSKIINLDKKQCDLNFLVDLCNIYLLNSLFHELDHAKQFTNTKKRSFKDNIINENIKFIYINPKLYSLNHDLYYHEYDALIKAYIKTLKVINSNCINLDENSIFIFNSIIAKIILHSYGNKYKNGTESRNYEHFKNPISYTKHLSTLWDKPKERKILSKSIKKLEDKSSTQYIKLLNGLEVSQNVIDILYNIYKKEINVKNIFDEIKKVDKIK